jgi:hypothetical protein
MIIYNRITYDPLTLLICNINLFYYYIVIIVNLYLLIYDLKKMRNSRRDEIRSEFLKLEI